MDELNVKNRHYATSALYSNYGKLIRKKEKRPFSAAAWKETPHLHVFFDLFHQFGLGDRHSHDLVVPFGINKINIPDDLY